MKTAKIRLESIKDSDAWFGLCCDLGLIPTVEEQGDEEPNHSVVYKMFEYGEYADLELIIDENFNIVGGKIIPSGK